MPGIVIRGVAADVDEFTNSARRISKARILEDFGSARDTGAEIMHATHSSRMLLVATVALQKAWELQQ